MCLFAAGLGIFADFPLVVVANREESLGRPTAGPRIHDESGQSLAWLGGQDLRAGGTWLGVNSAGLLVSVTNRPKLRRDNVLRSRGLLCRMLLETTTDLEAVLEVVDRELRQESYDGFNLLLYHGSRGVILEAGDSTVRRNLPPGLHVITNGNTDDPADARIRAAHAQLENAGSAEDWLAMAGQLARSHGTDAGQPPICLHHGDRGTVSSTIVALGVKAGTSIFRHADGPPCQTRRDDYSPLLESLLLSGAS